MRIVTESGSSSRYFSSAETKELFSLGPPGIVTDFTFLLFALILIRQPSNNNIEAAVYLIESFFKEVESCYFAFNCNVLNLQISSLIFYFHYFHIR